MLPSGTLFLPFVANRERTTNRFRYRGSADEPPSLIGKTMNMIRFILCATALLASAAPVHARPSDDTPRGTSITVESKGGDSPERVVPRQRPASGTPRLLSTNQWSEMMLKDDTVYLQLTDYGLKQALAPQDGKDKDEGFFGNVLKAMALSGVKQVLDHGLALALTDTRSAQVRDGQVVFVTCKGNEVFNQVKINNQVQKYPQEEAEGFVRNLNQVRSTLTACQP